MYITRAGDRILFPAVCCLRPFPPLPSPTHVCLDLFRSWARVQSVGRCQFSIRPIEAIFRASSFPKKTSYKTLKKKPLSRLASIFLLAQAINISVFFSSTKKNTVTRPNSLLLMTADPFCHGLDVRSGRTDPQEFGMVFLLLVWKAGHFEKNEEFECSGEGRNKSGLPVTTIITEIQNCQCDA